VPSWRDVWKEKWKTRNRERYKIESQKNEKKRRIEG
jgi:hypothetical protein